MLGPIDYIAVGFDGNHFDGSILNELGKAVEGGIIRVIDLVFIVKDEDGTFAAGEFEDQSDEIKSALAKLGIDNQMPLFAESDIEKIAKDMKPNTAAGVLIIEQVWAKGIKKALIDAQGTLIAEGRIHPDNVTAALEELENEAK